jgi:hypothetical protein
VTGSTRFAWSFGGSVAAGVVAGFGTAADEWLAKIPTWDWHATCAEIARSAAKRRGERSTMSSVIDNTDRNVASASG